MGTEGFSWSGSADSEDSVGVASDATLLAAAGPAAGSLMGKSDSAVMWSFGRSRSSFSDGL